MKKVLVFILFSVFINNISYSQYADLGSGSLKESIWWIDWDGFTVQNGAIKNLTTNTGLNITVEFSNVSGIIPFPNVMQTWAGGTLHNLYDFSNPQIKPVLYTIQSPNKTNYTIRVTVTKDGVQIPFSLITADGEASAAGEQTYVTTTGSNWQIIEFFRNSTQTTNPVIGCNTKSVYFTNTFDESALPQYKGQAALILSESAGQPITMDITYDKQPPHGASGLAFGILFGVDRGDLPSSYGYAHHRVNYTFQNTCNYNPPFPNSQQVKNLFMGATAGDPDREENSDDNLEGVDEDAINDFPAYDGLGTYTIEVPLVNTTGKPAYLAGWFDIDQNGVFSPGEMVTVTVPANATTASLSWQNLPWVIGTPLSKTFAFRFRLTTDEQASKSPNGYAPDGEVEDYLSELEILKNFLIINDYAAVNNFDNCDNTFTLDDATAFNVGDTVLVIQMKGAIIDSSNTATFGNIQNYNNAGNYEFNTVKSKNGNLVTLNFRLIRGYDFEKGKVQLVRVPYFEDFQINNPLSAMPWDGNKGGVLCFNASGTVTMNAPIDVTGKGFRSGSELQNSSITPDMTGYYYDAASNNGGEKGEGIASVSESKMYGRGALANGGGGGNAINSGGGGGANGGRGGNGGDQYQGLKGIAEITGGKGGLALQNSSAINRLFMGGAGGMGQANDLAEFPAGGGGGIIIFSAGHLKSNGFSIEANGENAIEAPTPDDAKDGMSGGGGGGTISLSIADIMESTSINAKGGKGADQPSFIYSGRHGGGGGGGGGVVTVSQTAFSPQLVVNVSGGMNGLNTGYGNDAWGSTPGEAGLTFTGFQHAIGNITFQPNITSVDIKDSLYECKTIDFKGTALVLSAPITTWDWSFGDGINNSVNLQTQVHNYTTQGTFPVKLIVTDADGCKDSTQISVNTYVPDITKSADTAICENTSVQLFVSGGTSYNWTPSTLLDDSNSSDPVATPLVTTKFYVDTYIADGCETKDSILVTVNPAPQITMSNDTTICKGTSATLSASGGDTYQWTPAQTLSSNNIFNPVANPVESTKYYVKASSNGCSAEDSVLVSVFPVPNIQLTTEPLICINSEAELTATGGSSYYWTPANLLHSQTGPTVSSQPLQTDATFYVEVTDEHTCIYNDSVSVKVRAETGFTVSRDTSVCTNNTIQLSASGGDVYDWSPKENIQGSSTSSTITALIDESMNFSVVITENICHKTETLTVPVSALPLPVVVAGKSNDITCSTPTAQLNVTGSGVSFLWTPAETLNNTAIPNPVATPKSNTVYSVKATDVNGCINYDSVLVKTDFTDMSPSVMPNAFTPNGDGLNDCFGVRHLAPIQDLDFRIYNRYGQLIFRTSDPSACWDGTFKGEPQNSGAFAYVVSGRRTCEVVNLKGKVILIR